MKEFRRGLWSFQAEGGGHTDTHAIAIGGDDAAALSPCQPVQLPTAHDPKQMHQQSDASYQDK